MKIQEALENEKQRIEQSTWNKVFASVNSFLGVLGHYSSFNIRCRLFLTPQLLQISSFDKGVNKFLTPIY